MKMNVMVGVIAILWVGMILAIGMESIVKFNTPTLTKAVGFDVGRTVFFAFNKMQGILLVLLIIGAIIGSLTWVDRGLILVIAILLALQVFWLFPELAHRVDLILSGVKPPSTYKHALYGIFEIVKVVLLMVLGIKLIV